MKRGFLFGLGSFLIIAGVGVLVGVVLGTIRVLGVVLTLITLPGRRSYSSGSFGTLSPLPAARRCWVAARLSCCRCGNFSGDRRGNSCACAVEVTRPDCHAVELTAK